jgi:hypothetical protein
MKLGVLTVGAYRLIIVISFWSISLFISMACPSLSHLVNVGLNSTLSEVSIATPAVFGAIGLVNLLAFHPKPMLISVGEMGLLKATNCWIFLFNPVPQMVLFDGRIKSINIKC